MMGGRIERISIIRKEDMSLKRVKFVKAYPPYKVGDIAGFNEADAKALLEKEVVETDEVAEVKVTKKAVVKPPADKMVKAPVIKK